MEETTCSACGRGMSLKDLDSNTFREVDGKLYCPECVLKMGQPKKMRCPHCGKQTTAVLHGDKYTCTHCGSEIGGRQGSGVIASARPVGVSKSELEELEVTSPATPRRKRNTGVQVLAIVLAVFIASTMVLGALLVKTLVEKNGRPQRAAKTRQQAPAGDEAETAAANDRRIVQLIEDWVKTNPKDYKKKIEIYRDAAKRIVDPVLQAKARVALSDLEGEQQRAAELLQKENTDLRGKLETALAEIEQLKKRPQLSTPKVAHLDKGPTALKPTDPRPKLSDAERRELEAKTAYREALLKAQKFADNGRKYGRAMETMKKVAQDYHGTTGGRQAHDERQRFRRDAEQEYRKQVARADELVRAGDFSGARELYATLHAFGVSTVNELVRQQLEKIRRLEEKTPKTTEPAGRAKVVRALKRLIGRSETFETKQGPKSGTVKRVTDEAIVLDRSFKIGGKTIVRTYQVLIADLTAETLDRLERIAAAPVEHIPAVVKKAIDALKHKDEGVRSDAAQRLGDLGSKAAVPHLITALKDKEWSVRMRAAESLGKLRDVRAVLALIDMLDDGWETVKFDAHQALLALTGQQFGMEQKAKWVAWYKANEAKLTRPVSPAPPRSKSSFRSTVLKRGYNPDTVKFVVPKGVVVAAGTTVKLLKNAERLCDVVIKQVATEEAYGRIASLQAGAKLGPGDQITVQLPK